GVKRRSNPVLAADLLDCFAEPVIGPATSGRTRWLAMTRPVLVRQRVRTHLNVNRNRRHAFAAFLEPRRPVPLRRPPTSAFPASLRIVDARIESLGIEAERVGDPQQYHLAV